MKPEERNGFLFVGLAVFLFSTSPVLIRWAGATLTAYEIAFGRMIVAAVIVLMVALFRRERFPSRRDLPRFLAFGLVTAGHFVLYIASLEYTTIAHSLALVYTAPIFVAVFSWIYLNERISLRQWLGVGVVVLGVAVLAGFEPQFTRRMLVGDVMAVGSAICFGIYSVFGRSQRNRYPLTSYAGLVYGMAALWLMPPAVFSFTPNGYTLPAVLSVVALGAFPLGLGHTLYNAALRRISATYVNLIATQEVTGGILLGVLFLGEIPTIASLFGAIVTLTGIVLVVL